MPSPLITVVMPVRNEGDWLAATIRSIARNRSTDFPLEIAILDDASTDECCTSLARDLPSLEAPNTSIKVMRSEYRMGVPGSRNLAASLAGAEILFITDAHVEFCQGWERIVLEHLSENRILAATIADPTSQFRGYGCRLVVPFMGTYWNKEPLASARPVQIAACIGTVLHRELFRRLEGYDSGMRVYGAAEPEFSVRAWLAGAEIVCVPELLLAHRFKPKNERDSFIQEVRPSMIHNSLRFGLSYLSERGAMQLVRYYSMKFPKHVGQALRMLDLAEIEERRGWLRANLTHDFYWFVEKFGVRDDVGRPLL